MDFIHLKNVSDRENSKKLCEHQRVQGRKIFRLCTGQKSSTSSFNPDDVVFNFSSRLISDKEKEILSKGLNFAVPPTRLNVCSFLTPFEKFYNLLKQEPVNVCPGFFPTLLFIFAGRTEHSERSPERQQYCHHETRQRQRRSHR